MEMADPTAAHSSSAPGEQVPLDIRAIGPAATGNDHGVVSEHGSVSRRLERGGPSLDRRNFVKQPDPPRRLNPVDDLGKFAREGQRSAQVLWPELVARHVDDLSRVDIGSTAECGGGVEQNDGLADSTRAGENDKTIGHRPDGNIQQDVRAVAEIALGALLEEPMGRLPRGR
jgi:hypothetical protein